MTDQDHAIATGVPRDAVRDLTARIASLRAAGAERFDPVRFHYIDTLAKRAEVHAGQAKSLLEAKLDRALETLRERFERAQCEARESVERNARQHPDAAGDLQRLFDASDFKGLQQRIASLRSRAQDLALGALVHQLEQHSLESSEPVPADRLASRPELKAIRNFRNTWSKLSADKQVAQALEQAPKNAGPINSHMLALRSLALMRDISPDYLSRFVSYADTLLRLDQGEKDKPASTKKRSASKAAKE